MMMPVTVSFDIHLYGIALQNDFGCLAAAPPSITIQVQVKLITALPPATYTLIACIIMYWFTLIPAKVPFFPTPLIV